MQLPKRDPFAELVFRYIISFTDLFNCMKMGEELSKDAKKEEQAIAGVWNDKVRKDCMSMLTAVTEDTHNAQIIFYRTALVKVDDISAVVVVDMELSFRMTDGTGLQLRNELIHKRMKNRF